MVEPTLHFLGEQIARIQAELRDLRGVRTDMAHMRAEIAAGDERLQRRIDALEAEIAQRFDAQDRANDARFAQVQETMTTHLQIMLAALAGKG